MNVSKTVKQNLTLLLQFANRHSSNSGVWTYSDMAASKSASSKAYRYSTVWVEGGKKHEREREREREIKKHERERERCKSSVLAKGGKRGKLPPFSESPPPFLTPPPFIL